MPYWDFGGNSYDDGLVKVVIIRPEYNETSQIPLLVLPVLIEVWARLLKLALEPRRVDGL